jgi:autotransporter adhesin
MGINPGNLAFNLPADPGRKQRDLERQQREQAAGKTGQAMQVGAGGILITNGGSLTISGSGSLNVGSGALNSAGSISAGTTITAGGAISAGGALSGASLNVGGGGVAGGAFSGTTCSLTSDLSAANVRLGGSGTIYSTYALSNPVVTAYVAAYINGPDGRFGATPSARRFKQNIRHKQYTVEDAKRLSQLVVNYRLKEAVKAYGDDAPVEVGVIAEELIKAGFPEFVIHDAKGRTLSVAYERIWLVIGSAFGELAADVDAIKSRLGLD